MIDVKRESMDMAAYAQLGLVANPFAPHDPGASLATQLEVGSQANMFLAAVKSNAEREAPAPIRVLKPAEFPPSYALNAISDAEYVLSNDSSLNVLHAYVQLFMMRQGRVRAILSILAERLVFRDFLGTLEAYVHHVNSEPDAELPARAALEPGDLDAFMADFGADPRETLTRVFGAPDIERRPELADFVDLRLTGLESDVAEADEHDEVDATLLDPPGAHDDPLASVPEEGTDHAADPDDVTSDDATSDPGPYESRVADYFIDYARHHLSPVIARMLRVYRSRGLAAAAAELKITKAPRKTLKAIARLARMRFSGVVIILDGFDNWAGVPAETRIKIAGTFFELQMLLSPEASFALLAEQGLAQEVENVFGSADVVDWEFPNLVEVQENPDRFDPEVINRWCSAAALAGTAPLGLADPVLASLAEAANGSLASFVLMAREAVDDAARRGSSALDEQARTVGLAAAESR